MFRNDDSTAPRTTVEESETGRILGAGFEGPSETCFPLRAFDIGRLTMRNLIRLCPGRIESGYG